MAEVRVLVQFRTFRVQSWLFDEISQWFCMVLRWGVQKTMFLDSSMQNHVEPLWDYLKKSVLEPKHATFNQNSDFGHVRTYSWLHKLRNTQGKIYGTYLGNIYGIYKEYIRNIHKYLWYKMIRNISRKHRPNGAAAEGGACVSDHFIS